MDQSWPPCVDEHATVLAVAPEHARRASWRYLDDRLRTTAASPIRLLLDTRPRAGFEIAAEEPPHRLTPSGRHRFSRDVRLHVVATHRLLRGLQDRVAR
jgi:hypothetical protein